MTTYIDIRIVPADGFGQNWYCPPQWATPTHGRQKAVEVRSAYRDVAGQWRYSNLMTVYSVKTDNGEFWAVLGTDGMWRRRDAHAF